MLLPARAVVDLEAGGLSGRGKSGEPAVGRDTRRDAAIARDRLGVRRGRRLVVLVVTVAIGAAACVSPPVVLPGQGEPGAAGPCGTRTTHLQNPVDSRHDLVVVEPTGGGSPWTGGQCGDDERPGIFVAHGYTGNFVEGYQAMVDHLVSNGFVVVFPGYTIEFDPPHQYEVVDSGFVLGAETSGRIDLDRIGVIGHSFGGGMAQWLIQQAARRGWGSEATWVVNFAPWYALEVGTAQIGLPAHTQYTMVSYEWDYFVDTRIAIEIYRSLSIPESQRRHVMVFSDTAAEPQLNADHLGPVSVELVKGLGTVSTDHFDHWVTFRTIDATAGCSLAEKWCGHDFANTGTRVGGKPVKRAEVRHDQPDVGPPALQECTFFINPRPCP